MPSSASKLEKFWRLPPADKWLHVRAVYWLAVARVMLVAVPFRQLSERLAKSPGQSHALPDADYLQRVGDAVRASANIVPWRSDCFPKAIAARMMLKRAGYPTTIHLGVEKAGNSEIAGHAWLTCGDTVVTGGGDLDRYTEMYCITA